MKRIVISLLVFALMLVGAMSVHAAEAEITVQVCASKTEVQVGDTVEYTVLATGTGVVAMQFEVRFPEGLRYVPNSGATPDNLAKKLGVPAADWTEISKMFTFYNDIGIVFAEGTEILRFTCVAEKEGQLSPELYELLPFNGDFEEFVPKLQIQSVQVKSAQVQIEPPVTEATVPPTVGQTEPTVVTPENPVTPSLPDDTEEITRPVMVPDLTEGDVSADHVTEPTEQIQNASRPDEDQTTGPEIGTEPQINPLPEETPTKNTWIWIVLLGGSLVIGGGVTVFILVKRKDP